jgi:pyruvate dehydrogenase E1 component alpha subunit
MQTKESATPMLKQMDNQPLLALYRTMRLIRAAENALIKLFADSEIPGFIHLSVGQEAIAAGVMSALEPRDSMATTHRGHGHVIARGIDLDQFFMELMGKDGGICRGRGGSMHVADMDKGILGANGIVGAGIPIALGSALAHSVRKTGGMAVVFFGDGAMAEGVLHESMNLAALWKLPMLFICENNGWSEFSPTSEQFAAQLGDLSRAFRIPHTLVDGNDVEAVAAATCTLVAQARTDGPRVLECKTHRVRGHFEGDPQKYRPADEMLSGDGVDPLAIAENRLRDAGVADDLIAGIADQAEAMVAASVGKARAAAQADFAAAFADVYTAVPAVG